MKKQTTRLKTLAVIFLTVICFFFTSNFIVAQEKSGFPGISYIGISPLKPFLSNCIHFHAGTKYNTLNSLGIDVNIYTRFPSLMSETLLYNPPKGIKIFVHHRWYDFFNSALQEYIQLSWGGGYFNDEIEYGAWGYDPLRIETEFFALGGALFMGTSYEITKTLSLNPSFGIQGLIPLVNKTIRSESGTVYSRPVKGNLALFTDAQKWKMRGPGSILVLNLVIDFSLAKQ